MISRRPENLVEARYRFEEGNFQMLDRLAEISAEDEAVVRMRSQFVPGCTVRFVGEVYVGDCVEAAWRDQGEFGGCARSR